MLFDREDREDLGGPGRTWEDRGRSPGACTREVPRGGPGEAPVVEAQRWLLRAELRLLGWSTWDFLPGRSKTAVSAPADLPCASRKSHRTLPRTVMAVSGSTGVCSWPSCSTGRSGCTFAPTRTRRPSRSCPSGARRNPGDRSKGARAWSRSLPWPRAPRQEQGAAALVREARGAGVPALGCGVVRRREYYERAAIRRQGAKGLATPSSAEASCG